jgi:hypothetical protein
LGGLVFILLFLYYRTSEKSIPHDVHSPGRCPCFEFSRLRQRYAGLRCATAAELAGIVSFPENRYNDTTIRQGGFDF